MADRDCRVTVVSPDRRVDLSLPGAVPVGDLMGQLLELCTDHRDRTVALAWTLRPVGGPGLASAISLDSARIRDGSVLELCPRSSGAARSVIEDVRDATEDAVDQTVGGWSRRDTTTTAALTLAAVAVVVLTLPQLWVSWSVNGLPVAVLAAAGSLWACIGASRRGLDIAAHVFLAVGLAWTAAAVMAAAAPSSVGSAGLSSAGRAALMAATTAVAALIIARVVPGLVAWSAAVLVVVGAALGWAASDLAGGSVDDAVCVGSVLGVMVLGVLPRVSLAAGGLAGLDYVVRTHGGVEPGTVVATFTRSRAILTGALLATAGLTAAGSVRLALAGSPMQVTLAAVVAGCLLLRARAFSQFLHVLTLVLAGVTALLAQASADLLDDQPRLTSTGMLVLVAAGSALLIRGGMSRRNDVAGARSRRLLDIAESLAVATLIPLLAGNLGVLDWVRELVD